MSEAPLVQVSDLVKHFPVARGWFGFGRDRPAVRAVDGVSFGIGGGKTLGLVGESGCGKTTVGRAILRLVEPDAGRVAVEGVDVLAVSKEDLRALRRKMQI